MPEMIDVICPVCGVSFATYIRSAYRRKTCGNLNCLAELRRRAQEHGVETRRISAEGWKR